MSKAIWSPLPCIPERAAFGWTWVDRSADGLAKDSHEEEALNPEEVKKRKEWDDLSTPYCFSLYSIAHLNRMTKVEGST